VPDDWELNDGLHKEEVYFFAVLLPWEMFFDSAVWRDGAGAGIVLVSLEKHILPYSFVLVDLCSNNVADIKRSY